MRVIKSLNNNVALALDDAGDEVVIIGNGVGFPSMPYELEDASRVRQVFRSVDASSYAALSSITESVMQAALDIVEDASSCIASELSPNVALTLAIICSSLLNAFAAAFVLLIPLLMKSRLYIHLRLPLAAAG